MIKWTRTSRLSLNNSLSCDLRRWWGAREPRPTRVRATSAFCGSASGFRVERSREVSASCFRFRLEVSASGFRDERAQEQHLRLACRLQGSGYRVQGTGFRVQGSGYRVQGTGFSGWWFSVCGSGSCLRLIDSCITQLKAQGASRTCSESKEEEEEVWSLGCGVPEHGRAAGRWSFGISSSSLLLSSLELRDTKVYAP